MKIKINNKRWRFLRYSNFLIVSFIFFFILLASTAVYAIGYFSYDPLANPSHFEMESNVSLWKSLTLDDPGYLEMELSKITHSDQDPLSILSIESKQGVSLILNKAGSNSNAFLEVRGANNFNEGLLIDQKGRLTFRDFSDTADTVLGGWKNYINFPSGGALVWPTRTNNQPGSADKLALFGHSINTDGFYWRTDADGTAKYIASLHDDGNFMVTGSITTGTPSSGLVLSGNTVKTRESGSLKLGTSSGTPVEITNDTVTVGGNLKVTKVISSSYCLNSGNDCLGSEEVAPFCSTDQVFKKENGLWKCAEDIDTNFNVVNGVFSGSGVTQRKNETGAPIFVSVWGGNRNNNNDNGKPCDLSASMKGPRSGDFIPIIENKNNNYDLSKNICFISFVVPDKFEFKIESNPYVPSPSESSGAVSYSYVIFSNK